MRSRIVQLVDLLEPSTGYDSALESQHQLCAMSPETAEKHQKVLKLNPPLLHYYDRSHIMYHRISPDCVLTSHQRKLCLLVTKLTGINKYDLSKSIICKITVVIGESCVFPPLLLL